jgi:hypothetical protein
VAAVSKLRVLSYIAICLLLPSCAPPFDPGLSQAANLIGKMRLETRIGPLQWTERAKLESDAIFMPIRAGTEIEIGRGFVKSSTRDGIRSWYTWSIQNGGNTEYIVVPDEKAWAAGMPDAFPQYPTCLIQPLASGPTFVNLQFDLAQSGAWIMSEDTGLTPPEIIVFPSYVFPDLMTMPNYVRTLGGHISPSSAGTSDDVFCLVNTLTGFWEVQSQITAAALNAFSTLSSNLSLPFLAGPPASKRCLYFHDANAKKSFALVYVNDAWQCWTWPTDPVGEPVQLSGITRRIDALLSTGRLFSTQEGIGTIYGSDGVVLASFPLGALRFVCETYVAGETRVLFSLMTSMESSVVFYLYSIPAADLAALK